MLIVKVFHFNIIYYLIMHSKKIIIHSRGQKCVEACCCWLLLSLITELL